MKKAKNLKSRSFNETGQMIVIETAVCQDIYIETVIINLVLLCGSTNFRMYYTQISNQKKRR